MIAGRVIFDYSLFVRRFAFYVGQASLLVMSKRERLLSGGNPNEFTSDYLAEAVLHFCGSSTVSFAVFVHPLL
jgi:hypothetical protein